MARSHAVKADGRAVEKVAAIRDAMDAGNGAAALAEACAALRSEAEKWRKHHHPGEAMRVYAQLAGLLAGYAASLHGCQPPAGSPAAVFMTSFEQVVTGVTPVSGVNGGARHDRV
jgi:hypothetical protein